MQRTAARALPFFKRIGDADLDRLLDLATVRRVPQGEAIFKQGQQATNFYLLLSGRLKVTQVTPDGQQIIVRVVHPGELFGFAKALARTDYPGTAIAATDSMTLGWPDHFWPEFVERNPNVAVNAIETLGRQLDEAHTRIREMSTEEAARRIANAILRLSKKAGRHQAAGIQIGFPISRKDIAEMTGTTLHTVSRILSAWDTRGLVEAGRQKIVIRDLPGLARLAEGVSD